MQTTSDKQQKQLLKRFHTLLGKLGGGAGEAKAAILDSFGVDSSRDLSAHELLDVCEHLERTLNPSLAERDRNRKRLIAAIGGWLKVMNLRSDILIIKAIACRAAGVKDFNKITDERLRSLYYAFQKKQKDLAFVDEITAEELDYLTTLN